MLFFSPKSIARNKFLAVIFFIFYCSLLFITEVYASGYTITQITNNDFDDYSPRINNGQIVWSVWDGNDSEIFLYDGSRIIQLTNNEYDDSYYEIKNGNVAWIGYDGNDYEIYLYNGAQTIQLTDNNYDDWYFEMDDNGRVAWGGHESEIFLYDGTKTKQLTNTSYRKAPPRIHNGQVVWLAYPTINKGEIFLYDGAGVTQITNGTDYSAGSPRIHNNQIAWSGFTCPCSYGFCGCDEEIFLYRGGRTIQITDDNYSDQNPQIYNGQVLWRSFIEGKFEIFLYTGSRTIQVTDNDYREDWFKIIGDKEVIWYSNDSELFLYNSGQVINFGRADFCPRFSDGQMTWSRYSDDNAPEIFIYDGNSVIQLTNNDSFDYSPDIHNGEAAWYGWDGNDYEIFLAKPAITAEQPVLQIFDASDFSAGREVTVDTEQIVSTIKAGQAVVVEGATTDGVARLLLKVDVPQSGSVKFTLSGTGNSKEDGVLYALGNT